MIFRTMTCALFASSFLLTTPVAALADDASTVTIKNFDYAPMALTVSPPESCRSCPGIELDAGCELIHCS